MLTGWLWLDPAVSLVIAAVVCWSGWGLARDSVNLALDGVPRGIELVKVRDYLAGLEGVAEVHDLHIWAMSTSETALTAHLVRPGGTDDAFLHHVCEELSHRFNIHHATLQIETAAEACKLAPAERVYARSVGWVERSDTHQILAVLMGIAALHPSYARTLAKYRFSPTLPASGTKQAPRQTVRRPSSAHTRRVEDGAWMLG